MVHVAHSNMNLQIFVYKNFFLVKACDMPQQLRYHSRCSHPNSECLGLSLRDASGLSPRWCMHPERQLQMVQAIGPSHSNKRPRLNSRLSGNLVQPQVSSAIKEWAIKWKTLSLLHMCTLSCSLVFLLFSRSWSLTFFLFHPTFQIKINKSVKFTKY